MMPIGVGDGPNPFKVKINIFLNFLTLLKHVNNTYWVSKLVVVLESTEIRDNQLLSFLLRR